MPDRMQLFAMPFAGGSAYSYHFLEPLLPRQVEFIPVEYPGRGKRAGERLLTSIDALADDVFRKIGGRLKEPFAFYGHSMGALLSYLVAHRLADAGAPGPVHLILSGRRAPSVDSREPRVHHLGRTEFLEKVQQLGGCPQGLFDDPGAGAFFEPILRADFGCVENYLIEPRDRLSVPITVLYGLEERLEEADVRPWSAETLGNTDFHAFPGNHFFIFQHACTIAAIISKILIPDIWSEKCFT